MKRAISHLATTDCLLSLAEVAKQGNYCRWFPLMLTINIDACAGSCILCVCWGIVYISLCGWVCVWLCVWWWGGGWSSSVVSYRLRQAVCGCMHQAEHCALPEYQHLSHSLTHNHLYSVYFCTLDFSFFLHPHRSTECVLSCSFLLTSAHCKFLTLAVLNVAFSYNSWKSVLAVFWSRKRKMICKPVKENWASWMGKRKTSHETTQLLQGIKLLIHLFVCVLTPGLWL